MLATCVHTCVCVTWPTLKMLGDGEWVWIWLCAPRISRLDFTTSFKAQLHLT